VISSFDFKKGWSDDEIQNRLVWPLKKNSKAQGLWLYRSTIKDLRCIKWEERVYMKMLCKVITVNTFLDCI
jgi:hypothetical protein